MRRFPWQTGKQRGMDLETRINLLRCGSRHDPDADCQAMLLDNVDGQHSSDGVDGDGERTTGDDGAREREPFLWRSVPDECLMKCARLGVIPAPTALLYRRFPDPPIALPRRPPLRTSRRRTQPQRYPPRPHRLRTTSHCMHNPHNSTSHDLRRLPKIL